MVDTKFQWTAGNAEVLWFWADWN